MMFGKIYLCDAKLDKFVVCYGKKKCPYVRIIINDIVRNDKKK